MFASTWFSFTKLMLQKSQTKRHRNTRQKKWENKIKYSNRINKQKKLKNKKRQQASGQIDHWDKIYVFVSLCKCVMNKKIQHHHKARKIP